MSLSLLSLFLFLYLSVSLASKRHLCVCVWVDLSSTAPHITQGENKGARCRNFVAPIFHLAWHKRGRFTCTCREVLGSGRVSKISPSVCHHFWKFIEGASASFRDIFWRHDGAKKSNSKKSCPFALLWYSLNGVRWEAYFMSESELKGGTARGASCHYLNFGACHRTKYIENA